MIQNQLKDIDYKETLPSIKDYWELFNTTGWNEEYNFSNTDLKKAISNSWYYISVYKKNKLIGFGRIISDGIHHALIVDLIILPDLQGKGIGGQLLERLINKCTGCNIRDIQLFSAKDKYSFYEKYKFIKRADNAPGMQYQY
jgi:N-acetylglutamate synthase-like GNAT family acetyltransferase